MRIQDYTSVALGAPHSRWPFVKTPFYTATDFPWQAGVMNWEANDQFVADYDLQCIYPAPVNVPFNQTTDYGYGGESDYPWIQWVADAGSIALGYRLNQPYSYTEVHVKTPQTSADTTVANFYCDNIAIQGVTFVWSRLDQNENYSSLPGSLHFTTFRFGVGVGADQVLYSVQHIGHGVVRISKSYTGGADWVDLENVRLSSNTWEAGWAQCDPKQAGSGDGNPGGDPSDAPTDYNVLEVRLIAGRISFRFGAQDESYSYEEWRVDSNEEPITTINHLRVRCSHFVALSFAAHPMSFRSYAQFDSQEIPIGFESDNLEDAVIDPAGVVPAGWAAILDPNYSDLRGPIVYYRLVMQGPVDGNYKGDDYSFSVAAVRAVNIIWFATVDSTRGMVSYDYPEEIVVANEFNPQDLQITSRCQLLHHANHAKWLPGGGWGTWGYWMMATGQLAGEIWLSRTTMSGYMGVPQRVFCGYAHTEGKMEGAQGEAKFSMFGADRSRQLRNPRWALPWLDGWNIFYAMAYLAQLGGVAIQDMGFAPYVPNIPYGEGSDLGDEDGQPAYYLPVGSAGSMLTRFSGVDLWEVMAKLAYAIGYMLFFDAGGMLQFRKFRVANGIKRMFFESDRESQLAGVGGYGGWGGAEGCWALEAGKTMDEVRNIAILAGIDTFSPKYDPIVYKYEDWPSIYDANAFNHLGYRNPSAWIDSQFASAGFAYDAARAMYAFQRMPGLWLRLTTWLQPDIFPLDMITVTSDRFGTTGLRYMVMASIHNVKKDLASTTLVGRYMPEGV